MSLAEHIQLLVWLLVSGLSLNCSAITLSTQTHCILISSGDVNRQAICPGESINVDKHVEIVAGFDDNSKSEKSQKPRWQQSFVIEPRSVIDMRGPGFSPDLQTAYWGSDNCLYGNPRMYPIVVPPVWLKPNHDYQKIGCATRQYAGPPIENPWNTQNYGTTPYPDITEPSGSGSDDDFLNQLRFYRDYEPLYRVLYGGQQKSDEDQKKKSDASSSSETTANADPSWFNTDLADQTDYSAFLPSSDDGDNSFSDITWDMNTDPGSNFSANLDSGTNDIFSSITDSNPDPNPGANSYADFNLDLDLGTDSSSSSSSFASSDSSSGYDFFNDDGLFTRKRSSRRSARDFSPLGP